MNPIAIIRAFIVVLFLWGFVICSPCPDVYVAGLVPTDTTTPNVCVLGNIQTTTPPVVAKPPVKTPLKKPATPLNLRLVGLSSFVSTADTFTELASGEMSVSNPTIRATVRGSVGQHARVVFTYVGNTASSAPLADGELRRQMAIKLLAQDLCNTLYVSWQFAPNARLQVLEKYNPGVSNFDVCGADGYTVVAPSASSPVPSVSVGSTHTLEAQIDSKNVLTVWADGKQVWQGSVATAVKHMTGPVGLRTDNAAFHLRYYAAL